MRNVSFWILLIVIISLGILVYWILTHPKSSDAWYHVPDAVCGEGLHIGNPHCITPTPTQEVTPTVTPAPTIEQGCEEDCYEITPTPTPTIEVIPTATPIPTEFQPQGLSQPQPPAVCNGSEIKYAPTVVEFNRVDIDSVWIRWTSVDDHIKNYIVQYGLTSGIPLWETEVKGSLDTTLNFLPPGHMIWVRVAGTDDCIRGNFGGWVDP